MGSKAMECVQEPKRSYTDPHPAFPGSCLLPCTPLRVYLPKPDPAPGPTPDVLLMHAPISGRLRFFRPRTGVYSPDSRLCRQRVLETEGFRAWEVF